MKIDAEWVRREVRRELAASVAAGIGAWSNEPDDPEFGAALYEYREDRSLVCLHETGLRRIVKQDSLRLGYEEIVEILPLTLAELVRVRDPNKKVSFPLRCRDGNVTVEVPLKVYSSLCPTLLRVVEGFRASKRE